MKLKKNQLFQWLFAFIISFFVCNLIVFLYEAPAGWIERRNAATSAIWNPGSTIVHGTEGYGIYKVDNHGYINTFDITEEGRYSLIVGASYTEGKEVMPGNRYIDLLNNEYFATDSMKFYSVSKNAFWFPEMMKRFKAIIGEFPSSSNIIFETRQITFSEEAWLDSLNQVDFDLDEVGDNITQNLPLKLKLITFIKEKLPLIGAINNQVNLISDLNNFEQTTTDLAMYTPEQLDLIDKALSLVRNQYSGNIYILYHPLVSIEVNGMLDIVEEPALEQFKQLCRDNQIVFVDVTDAFLQAYNESFIVPYGFFNTSMGTGHFNNSGHKIVAAELSAVLQGGE